MGCCASKLHGVEIENMKRKGKCYDVFIVYIFLVHITRGSYNSPYAFPCICLMIIAQSHFIFRFPNDITFNRYEPRNTFAVYFFSI